MAKHNRQNSLEQLYMGEFPPNIEAIQRSALRILKDICYGNIRFEDQGKYFLDENLLTALHYTATTRLNSNRVILAAMDFYVCSEQFKYLDPATRNIYVATHTGISERYNILNILVNALAIAISQGGRDISPLAMVQVQIQKYRRSISDI